MWAQTCLGVYREIVLPLSDGVHQPGAVSICGIVGVPGRDLDYGRACEREEATEVTSQATLLSTVVKAAGGFISLMWYSKSAYWIPSTYIGRIRGIMHSSAVDPRAQLLLQHSSFYIYVTKYGVCPWASGAAPDAVKFARIWQRRPQLCGNVMERREGQQRRKTRVGTAKGWRLFFSWFCQDSKVSDTFFSSHVLTVLHRRL